MSGSQAAQVEPAKDSSNITKKTGHVGDKVCGNIARVNADSAYTSVKLLRSCLATQDEGFKLLLQKAAALETWSVKFRNPEVKTAVEAVLEIITGMKISREKDHMAFNAMSQKIPKTDQLRGPLTPARATTSVSTQTLANEVKLDDPVTLMLEKIQEQLAE